MCEKLATKYSCFRLIFQSFFPKLKTVFIKGLFMQHCGVKKCFVLGFCSDLNSQNLLLWEKNQTQKKCWEMASCFDEKKRVFTKSETSVKYAKSWISFVVFNWCLGITLFLLWAFNIFCHSRFVQSNKALFYLIMTPRKKYSLAICILPKKNSLKGNLNLLVKCYHLTTSWPCIWQKS